MLQLVAQGLQPERPLILASPPHYDLTAHMETVMPRPRLREPLIQQFLVFQEGSVHFHMSRGWENGFK